MRDVQILGRSLFQLKQKPVVFNYLNLIWDVKILLAKIKDCKGKDFQNTTNKSLPQKTPFSACLRPGYDG